MKANDASVVSELTSEDIFSVVQIRTYRHDYYYCVVLEYILHEMNGCSNLQAQK